jgi:hypothetical protein
MIAKHQFPVTISRHLRLQEVVKQLKTEPGKQMGKRATPITIFTISGRSQFIVLLMQIVNASFINRQPEKTRHTAH